MIHASIYRDSTPQVLNAEQEEQKRHLYDHMKPHRRKFIDRIGYENWDPFPKPNDPFELRQDITKRTTQELVREFLQSKAYEEIDNRNEYSRGVLEAALGIVNRDEKILGIYEFCIWYNQLLEKEGLL